MIKWHIESTDVSDSYVDEYDKWQIFFPLSLQDISGIAGFSDLQEEWHHKKSIIIMFSGIVLVVKVFMKDGLLKNHLLVFLLKNLN